MNEDKRIELLAPGGMHPRLAFIYSQMEDVRENFKEKAAGMTVEELDRTPVEDFMRPGQLLAHCAGGGKTLEEIIAYMDKVSAHTRRVLEAMEEDGLSREYPWDDEDGTRYIFSIEWVLHHLVEHEAHHRGQFMLLKRRMK